MDDELGTRLKAVAPDIDVDREWASIARRLGGGRERSMRVVGGVLAVVVFVAGVVAVAARRGDSDDDVVQAGSGDVDVTLPTLPVDLDLDTLVWTQLPTRLRPELDSGGCTSAVAAGDRAFVVHGATGQHDKVLGEVVDARAGSATPMSDSPLTWRCGFATAWTGSEVVVWGGSGAVDPAPQGAAYDPATDTWRAMADAPVLVAITGSVWTGSALLVFGHDGAATHLLSYSPARDAWEELAAGPLAPRDWAVSAWTGRELIVWGGCDVAEGQCQDPIAGDELGDGAAFDPGTGQWRTLAPAPAPLDYAAAAWSGSELYVWGGYGAVGTGLAYDPVADTWRMLPVAPLTGRIYHAVVWTGTDLIVWGGATEAGAFGDGARYSPELNLWLPLVPSVGALGPGPRTSHAARHDDRRPGPGRRPPDGRNLAARRAVAPTPR